MKSMRPEVFVHEGSVRLSSVQVIASGENMVVIHIDAHTKYALSCATVGERSVRVTFGLQSGSLGPGATQEPSFVDIKVGEGDWGAILNSGRYSHFVAIWRDGAERHELWVSP